MVRFPRVALVLLALPLLGANCRRGPADVTPITHEDESLRRNQDSLVGQRGALQRERKKLTDERAELVDRRKKLGHDSAGQAVLDEEERKLIEREQKLNAEEVELDRQLGELIKQRSELIKRATQVVATAPGADPLESAARREQGVASREKELAAREKDVAQREKDLAEREARLARRERDTCGGAAPVQIEIPKGLKYSAKDVEPTYKKALKLMQEKGLLPADLPPGSARLVDETREAMRKGDYVRAKYDADALYEAVKDIRIDREFISSKMNRLASAMKGTKLSGDHRKSVEQLFQEATAAYGDGQFSQANGKINRLFAMLK
jgi:hypothetical protein